MLLNKLREAGRPGRVLLAIAAPVEIRAVLAALRGEEEAKAAGNSLGEACENLPQLWGCVQGAPGVDVLHVGVGKANAAGGVAQWLTPRPSSYGLVMSIGIAGALPTTKVDGYRAQVGETVVATACDFADEGILTELGYKDVSEIGFPIDSRYKSTFPCDNLALEVISPFCTHAGQITAVSTCSATDALAQAIAQRTPAMCEAMEGAAIALVCLRQLVPMIEVRAMSNVTGSRTHQGWDIAKALAALATLVRRLDGR